MPRETQGQTLAREAKRSFALFRHLPPKHATAPFFFFSSINLGVENFSLRQMFQPRYKNVVTFIPKLWCDTPCLLLEDASLPPKTRVVLSYHMIQQVMTHMYSGATINTPLRGKLRKTPRGAECSLLLSSNIQHYLKGKFLPRGGPRI